MQGREIDRRFRRPGEPIAEIGSVFQELRLPPRDLGRVHIKLRGQLRMRLVTLEGSQCGLDPEGRGKITAVSSVHVVLHIAVAYHALVKEKSTYRVAQNGGANSDRRPLYTSKTNVAATRTLSESQDSRLECEHR